MTLNDLTYREGRLDQALWLVDYLKAHIVAHDLSDSVRLFLIDLNLANATEAQHGTRAAVPVQSGA